MTSLAFIIGILPLYHTQNCPLDILWFGHLNRVGAGINDRLEVAGSENRIGMAMQPNADGSTSIHMLINNSETKLQNVLGLAQGKDTDSSIKVATIPKK